MKREAQFQLWFNKYLRQKKLYGYFELKQTTTDSIPFDAVDAHQLESLSAAQKTGIVYKISDSDQRIKPFDCFNAPPQPSYIVIRYPKTCYIITLTNFLIEKASSKRKSLTEKRAEEICLLDIAL